jgi:hypothetical protein
MDGAFVMCAEHIRQLGGGSPLDNLMEVKSQEYLSRRKFNPFSLILLLFDFCNFSS